MKQDSLPTLLRVLIIFLVPKTGNTKMMDTQVTDLHVLACFIPGSVAIKYAGLNPQGLQALRWSKLGQAGRAPKSLLETWRSFPTPQPSSFADHLTRT